MKKLRWQLTGLAILIAFAWVSNTFDKAVQWFERRETESQFTTQESKDYQRELEAIVPAGSEVRTADLTESNAMAAYITLPPSSPTDIRAFLERAQPVMDAQLAKKDTVSSIDVLFDGHPVTFYHEDELPNLAEQWDMANTYLPQMEHKSDTVNFLPSTVEFSERDTASPATCASILPARKGAFDSSFTMVVFSNCGGTRVYFTGDTYLTDFAEMMKQLEPFPPDSYLFVRENGELDIRISKDTSARNTAVLKKWRHGNVQIETKR